MKKERFSGLKKFFHTIGSFFRRLGKKIASYKLYTLVVMQLKDKWNMSFKTNKKMTIFKLVAYVIVFAVIVFAIKMMMDLSTNSLGIFIGMKIPLSAMVPILTLVTVFEVISILVGMTKALYFSKDNVVLVTYPVKSDYLFMSKLIVYYLDAVKKSFTLFVPLFFAFGLVYNNPVYYYFWVIFLDLFYVAILVLICGLLSIPTYFILRFLDRFKGIKIVLAIALLGGLIYGTIALLNVIPDNLNIIEEYQAFTRGLNRFLTDYRNTMFLSRVLSGMFFGVYSSSTVSLQIFNLYSWSVLLSIIALIVIFIFINMFVSKPFYTKMIARSNSSNTAKKKARKNHTHHKLTSVLNYEMKRILRDEKIIVSSLLAIVILPLFIAIANKIYNSMNTDPIGNSFIVIFNFFFISIAVTGHNTTSAYIYSKDGPSWSINKTMPINPEASLSLRLIYNIVISLFMIIPASIIAFKSEYLANYSVVLFILALVLVAIFHNVISASYDFSHSKNKDKADIGSEIVSTHTAVSLIYSIVCVAVSAGFLFICLLTTSKNPLLRLFLLWAVLTMILVYYFLRKIHLSYQEN